ncbi:MAG: DUF4416 family protein [bacterium]|nr:DUF4416 family protein [bacterium]
MGTENKFKKVRFFSGFIYRDRDIYREFKEKLEYRLSPIDMVSDEFTFQFTSYYNDEMGTPLFRQFVSFRELISPEELPITKRFTNRLEIESSESGKRRVNIDPGYISDANVILATTKNHYHRVPLAQGIYAHIEYLIKKKNTLTTLEWTYPDFKSQEYMDFFNRLMQQYKQDIRQKREEIEDEEWMTEDEE